MTQAEGPDGPARLVDRAHKDLRGIRFVGAELTGCDLTETDLRGAGLGGADLSALPWG